MGDFTAEFPRDRHYATNHMWAKQVQPGTWRFGLTAYAVRLLQDVYFLDWTSEPSTPLKSRANIGSIESKKAESDLYSPLAGTLTAINDATLDDPSLINADAYGDGWLIEIQTDPRWLRGTLDSSLGRRPANDQRPSQRRLGNVE
jgi:glycine cleavage system H protein